MSVSITRTGVVRVALVLVGLVVGLAGVQVARVHGSTGEFRLTPSPAPPKLQEFGRDYRRSDSPARTSSPRGVREVGSTAGGGEVLIPAKLALQGARSHAVPTVILVRDHAGRVWTYALVGGP